MSYLEDQRQKAVQLRDVIFKDPGGGIFKKAEREFVLKDPSLNIWAGIREDAISYFNRCGIPFWDSGNQLQADIKPELPILSTLPTASTKNTNPDYF